jgi:hypothetical protein
MIVEARRAGRDDDAKLLSQEQASLKRRVKNICPDCGIPIAKGAQFCRTHMPRQKAKALPLPEGFQTTSKPQPPRRERHLPYEGHAQCGYWIPAVQEVVRKWRPSIGEENCKRYLFQVLSAVKRNCIDVPGVHPDHLAYAIDLFAVVLKVWSDTAKPYAWLIRFANSGRQIQLGNGVRWTLSSYGEIQEMILNGGGPSFTKPALRKAAGRMRLSDRIAG